MREIYSYYDGFDFREKIFFYRPLKMEMILLMNNLKSLNIFSVFKMIYFSILRYYLLNKKIVLRFKNIINI